MCRVGAVVWSIDDAIVEQIFGIGTARCSETAIWEDVLMNDGHKNAFGAGLIDVVERL